MLLDGPNRYEMCSRLGIKYKTVTIKRPTREDALLWIVVNQILRRNLTPTQRAALAVELKKSSPKRPSSANAHTGKPRPDAKNTCGKFSTSV